jgi:hypothetical protein
MGLITPKIGLFIEYALHTQTAPNVVREISLTYLIPLYTAAIEMTDWIEQTHPDWLKYPEGR